MGNNPMKYLKDYGGTFYLCLRFFDLIWGFSFDARAVAFVVLLSIAGSI
jgi:hypothetical protein